MGARKWRGPGTILLPTSLQSWRAILSGKKHPRSEVSRTPGNISPVLPLLPECLKTPRENRMGKSCCPLSACLSASFINIHTESLHCARAHVQELRLDPAVNRTDRARRLRGDGPKHALHWLLHNSGWSAVLSVGPGQHWGSTQTLLTLLTFLCFSPSAWQTTGQ